jgi:hypothetical protein
MSILIYLEMAKTVLDGVKMFVVPALMTVNALINIFQFTEKYTGDNEKKQRQQQPHNNIVTAAAAQVHPVWAFVVTVVEWICNFLNLKVPGGRKQHEQQQMADAAQEQWRQEQPDLSRNLGLAFEKVITRNFSAIFHQGPLLFCVELNTYRYTEIPAHFKDYVTSLELAKKWYSWIGFGQDIRR